LACKPQGKSHFAEIGGGCLAQSPLSDQRQTLRTDLLALFRNWMVGKNCFRIPKSAFCFFVQTSSGSFAQAGAPDMGVEVRHEQRLIGL
jgi:hypothetical protein